MFHVEIFQVLNYTVQDGEKVQGQAMFLHQEVISYFPQFACVFREGQWQLSATGGQWSAWQAPPLPWRITHLLPIGLLIKVKRLLLR